MAKDATDDPLTGKTGPAQTASRRQPPIIEGEAQDVTVTHDKPSETTPPADAPAAAEAAQPNDALAAGKPSEPEAPAPTSQPTRGQGFNAAIAIPVGLALLAAGAAAAWLLKDTDSALGEAQSRIAALGSRMDALEGKLASGPAAVAALDKRIAAVEAAVKSATASSDAARAAAETAQAEARKAAETPRSGDQPAAAVDLSPLDKRVAAIEKRVPALETALTATKTDARVLASRESAASASGNAAAIAVVAETLVRAVERGAPFASELAALRGLGAPGDRLKALEPQAGKGVASLAALGDMFRAQAPAAVAAVTPKAEPAPLAAHPWDGFLNRLAGFVRIRKVGEPAPAATGVNPAAVDAALAKGDVAAALAAVDKWPEAAKIAAQDWAAAARQRADAIAAARAILAESIAALGKQK